jgi:DNA-directed RNA polymerase subunit RPC12/RpoP
MMLRFDQEYIEVACGKCGRKYSKTLAWLDANDDLACACGAKTTVKTVQVRVAGSGQNLGEDHRRQ